MQFYIVHEDPKISASRLPNYALKNVNIREGWQILSDIGHLFGVAWEGQNKHYSAYHAKTRTFWKSPEAFKYFINHYIACLQEYYQRFNKETSYQKKFTKFYNGYFDTLFSKMIELSDEQQDIMYLLKRKAEKISLEEQSVLRFTLGITKYDWAIENIKDIDSKDIE